MNNDSPVSIFLLKRVQTPQQVFDLYLDENDVQDVQELLWLMLKSTLSADDEIFDEPTNRDALIFKYEQLLAFIEAVYKLSGSKSNGSRLIQHNLKTA